MKIKSNPKNQTILHAHNRIVRHASGSFRIKVATLGAMLLANAEPITGSGPLLNLFGKTALERELRRDVENRLFS